MVVTKVGHGVHIEESQGVKSGIEHKPGIDVPISVDVLRPACTTTCCRVVGDHLTDSIARRVEEHVCHYSALVFLNIVVVEEHEVVGERGLQAWVTHSDAERVAVVNDVEEVGHARLRGATAIVETQFADL